VKSSLRREPDVPGDLLRAIFGNVTEPRRKHRAIQGDGWLSNPIFESLEDIVGHCYFAWNKLIAMPWKIISIGTMDPDQAISY